MADQNQPLLAPGQTLGSITDKISSVPLNPRVRMGWLGGMFIGFVLLQVLMISVIWLFAKGVGVWGVDIPVGWGFAITNFVWWIGIGHAGTLISAILLLLHQKWRNSINRFAEAMTLFAVSCAGLFPLIHVGRPWLAYWMFPYPNTMGLWPQFRSPLLWDVFAVSTYATVSALFWFVGLIPDLATMRDKAKNIWVKRIYGLLAMGWRGSARHWLRYDQASLLLAGLATPLVVSVHTIVSWDFAVSIIPGWHTTVFPPYFVAGAVYSGFAMVLTLCIPLRKYYHLEAFMTDRHIDIMAKVMLATGLIVGYGYMVEAFASWYSGNPFELYVIYNRLHGPYAIFYAFLLLYNLVIPQALWFQKVRQNTLLVFIISLIINLGMWLERFIIIVVSLHRDFLPSSWGMFYPTVWDFGALLGSVGLFVALIFLFVRVLPAITMFEIRDLVVEEAEHGTHE